MLDPQYATRVTRAEARTTILAAHAAGTLPAQHYIDGTYYSTQGNVVVRCAIGVLVTPEIAAALQGPVVDPTPQPKAIRELLGQHLYPMAEKLFELGILVTDDPDTEWYTKVQDAHDAWASSDDEDCPALEAKFLELVG